MVIQQLKYQRARDEFGSETIEYKLTHLALSQCRPKCCVASGTAPPLLEHLQLHQRQLLIFLQGYYDSVLLEKREGPHSPSTRSANKPAGLYVRNG